MTTIAFLGLGNMGAPMAANLVNAGYNVRGFDPVRAACDAAAEKGVAVFESGAGAVTGADVVFTMLPNGTLVKECYAEVMPTAAPGSLFIDSSTIAVGDARNVHAYAAERGFPSWTPRCPAESRRRRRTLAFMVGGETAALETARPVLEAMAGKIIHCGESGAGQAAKLCNNMLLAVQQIAVGGHSSQPRSSGCRLTRSSR